MLPRLFLFFLMGMIPLGAAHALNIITYTNTVTPLWQLVSSEPADNALLNSAPKTIMFTFSQNIDPGKSTVILYDPYNNPVGNLNVAAKGFSMTAQPSGTLSTGNYRVEWHGECLCKGVAGLQGTLHFTVQ